MRSCRMVISGKVRSTGLLLVLGMVLGGLAMPVKSHGQDQPRGGKTAGGEFGGEKSVRGTSASKPNVLFIAVDDLNDWIGCLGGHPQAKTPNIDRLLNRGVLFTQAYCAAPACNPSRVATMTGLRPSSTGIYMNPDEWRPVLPEAVTIPQHFRQHGYTAIGSGKIYHDAFADPASWDDYAPSLTKQKFPDQVQFPKNVNGLNKSHFDWSPLDAPIEKMSDSLTVDYVVEQLGRDWDQPFFLACGIYRPHLPWYVPQQFYDQFPLAEIQLPEVDPSDLDDIPAAGVKMAGPKGDHAAVVKSGQWEKAVQGYLASIAFADHLVGRVLDAFDRSPHKDNTIIVFWTDHGWHLGEKEHWRKFALWEEATRTPLGIIRPNCPSAGQRCATSVNLIDIYPTLIELCDLPTRPELEGESLVPLLDHPDQRRKSPSITTHGRNNHAVRTQDWRYIRYADGSEELYDHRNDPLEHRNLAGTSEVESILKEHRSLLPTVNVPRLNKNQ